jgi:hypothetical protein
MRNIGITLFPVDRLKNSFCAKKNIGIMSAAQVESIEKLEKRSHLTTDQRFKSTKSGLVGVQRDTMLENELHLLV